ncbi:hypothetical protein BST92_07215 [Nonlabens arenilitoris]|uniref:DUF4190 domain-containing protein n=1 Tax=Nonlabens arenilitoris TaxID=1217969 RepID=A0A2S7U9W9_9FLAO|nr:DUF4064 domain-containing protein [Nonlabens arenilitoris]PQJ31725.1 hypothetical protein BST92_07215 [Nonlabens arenilitoris]
MENNTNQNSSNQNRSWEDNNYSNAGYDSTRSYDQNQSSQNWSSQPYRSKLPADNSAMILAIIATVLFVLCCCIGGQYLALVLSIIGFALAHSSINKYQQNPEQYDPNSYKRVRNAKTFNLVVGIVSLILIALGFIGLFSNTFDDYNYLDMMNEDDEWYNEDYEYEESEVEDDWYEYEEEVDSLNETTDSLMNEAVELETIIEEAPLD